MLKAWSSSMRDRKASHRSSSTSCRPTHTEACPAQGPSAAAQAWVRGTRQRLRGPVARRSSRILVPRLSLSPQYCAGLLMATLGLSPAAMSWRRAPAGPRTRTAPAARPRRRSASTLGWAAGSASPRPGRARAPPASPAPSWRSMASKSAHTSSTLSCSSSASCRGTQSGLSSKAPGASPPRSWSSCTACSGC